MSSSRVLLKQQQQQLFSLLDWASTQLTRCASSSSSAAAATASKSIQYAKNRNSYKANLAELRKAWANEQEEKTLREETRAQALEAKRIAAQSQRASADAADKDARQQDLMARQQAAREVRAEEKEQRLRRQELRMDILDAARGARRQALLRESSNWIDAESLDARVQEALENVVPLWGEDGRTTGTVTAAAGGTK